MTSSSLDRPFFRLSNVVKTFGGVHALQGVSFEVNRGEVVALVGDNGAGKSTLFKIISGVLQPDRATFEVDGAEVDVQSVQDANRAGIYTVYQDLALCDNLDTISNLYLGSEITLPWYLGGRMNRPAMEHESRRVLDSLGVRIQALTTDVGSLSGGQRQSVAIVRAVLRDPKLILLDEPTAALGVEQTGQVLRLIRRLRDEGRAVAVVSHNMMDVLEVADRIVVLRLGQVVRIFDRVDATPDALVSAITGSTASALDAIPLEG